jgi:bacterioferritin
VQEFSLDIESLKNTARSKIEAGAITDSYGADRDRVVEVLNSVLATELVCVLRYKRHYFMALGMRSLPVAAEFLEHANQEQDHADRVAIRIVQLQGEPDLNPDTLTARSHADYAEGTDLVDMIQEDLIAERIAIASYQAIGRWLGEDDPTSRRLIESLLEVEQEHAEDLASLLAGL